MNCRLSTVFAGSALAIGLAMLPGLTAPAMVETSATAQDPERTGDRDRVIEIITELQEKNTFQKNIGLLCSAFYTPAGGSQRTNTSTIYYQLPGKRRKAWDQREILNIHVNDTRSVLFPTGKFGESQPMKFDPVMNTLLDITAIEPAAWISRAQKMGIDHDTLSEQEWDGRTHYVIGAEAGNLSEPQIWIEKETMRPSRAFMYQVRDSPRIFDYRVTGYETFEDGSIFLKGVDMYEGPYRINSDTYSRFEINREVNDGFFDVEKIDADLKKGRTIDVAGDGADIGAASG